MGDPAEDFLAHYGVKGMRWGVRKDRGDTTQAVSVGNGMAVVLKYNKNDVTVEANPGGGVNFIGTRKAVDSLKSQLANNPRVSEEHAKASQYANTPSSKLSNEELKVLTSRLELERKYASLVPKEVSRGKKVVDGLISAGDVANKVVSFANSPAGKMAINNVKKAAAKR